MSLRFGDTPLNRKHAGPPANRSQVENGRFDEQSRHLVWEPLSPFVQDTKGLVSRAFESLELEPGRLDYVVLEESYVPKIGIWDEYPRHLEEEYDSDTDTESNEGSAPSSSSERGFSPDSDFSVNTQWDEIVKPPSSSSDSSDDGRTTDVFSDDNDHDNIYSQPICRAASVDPTRFSFAPSSRASRAPRSGGKIGTQSAPCSPKRKFEEFDEVTDEEDNPDKAYKIIRDQSGKIIYQCRKCPDFCTKASGDMKRHLESLAHKPPSYHCPKPGCGAVFTRKDALKRHMLRQHGTSEKKI